MRRVVHIKVVPDAKPDAEGEWIERFVAEEVKGMGGEAYFRALTMSCPPGTHAVAARWPEHAGMPF